MLDEMAQKPPRYDEQDRRQHHEACGEPERSGRRAPHRRHVTAADGLSDDDAGSDRKAKRHHIRCRCKNECDLVCGNPCRTQPAHRQRDRCERAPFEQHLSADRRADANHAPQRPRCENAVGQFVDIRGNVTPGQRDQQQRAEQPSPGMQGKTSGPLQAVPAIATDDNSRTVDPREALITHHADAELTYRCAEAGDYTVRLRDDRRNNAYQLEQNAFVDAIRKDKPYNEGELAAMSSMMSVMARMTTYSGVEVTWEKALNSQQRLGPQTVPTMARARNVSRQHVQKSVDGLAAGGLVSLRDNPAHRRSPIVELSDAGKALFAAIAGALMYFATLTEVPIVQGLVGAGMGPGPSLTLLLAGPALSLPNMVVIASVIGWRKTSVYVGLVVVMATVTGLLLTVMQSASAGTINCGVHLIQDDTRIAVTKYEVLKKCGEPKLREGDTWFYEKSGSTVEITFKSGRISSIR